jgi:hypothetical protein
MIPIPPELLTAAERAGWRAACAAMRAEAARIERSGRQIAGTEPAALRGQLLQACGRMARIVADRTEDTLSSGRAPSLARPG